MARIGSFGTKVDINLRQGSTFIAQLAIRNPPTPDLVTGEIVPGDPVDLTGCIVRAQIRRKALDSAILAEFSSPIIDAVGGLVRLSMTDEATALIPAGETLKDSLSSAVWDAEFEDAAGNVLPICYGDVVILREVTRAV